MINKLEYNKSNFLRFHVKKGVEFLANTEEVVAVRTHTLSNIIELSKPLLVTAKGKTGALFIRPEDINPLKVGFREVIDKDYDLIFFAWKPFSYQDVVLLDKLYDTKAKLELQIKSFLNNGVKN